MGKRVSEQDQESAKALYAQNRTLKEIVSALGGRVSVGWLSMKARDEGWLRGILPPDLIAPDSPQVYEAANADPQTQNANTDKLEAAAKRRFVQRKAQLANKMADGAELLLSQMFSPQVIKDVRPVGMGGGVQEVRMIEYTLPEPSPADKKHLATTLGILLDKSLLLTGEATSRSENVQLNGDQAKTRLEHIRDELAERAASNAAKAAEQRNAPDVPDAAAG